MPRLRADSVSVQRAVPGMLTLHCPGGEKLGFLLSDSCPHPQDLNPDTFLLRVVSLAGVLHLAAERTPHPFPLPPTATPQGRLDFARELARLHADGDVILWSLPEKALSPRRPQSQRVSFRSSLQPRYALDAQSIEAAVQHVTRPIGMVERAAVERSLGACAWQDGSFCQGLGAELDMLANWTAGNVVDVRVLECSAAENEVPHHTVFCMALADELRQTDGTGGVSGRALETMRRAAAIMGISGPTQIRATDGQGQ